MVNKIIIPSMCLDSILTTKKGFDCYFGFKESNRKRTTLEFKK